MRYINHCGYTMASVMGAQLLMTTSWLTDASAVDEICRVKAGWHLPLVRLLTEAEGNSWNKNPPSN
jgi:hypothetical protein